MPYTSIEENSTINLAKTKKFLRIDSDDTVLDDILKLAILAAKQAADNYCQDTFETVPAPIELWILSVIQLWWERKNPFIVSTEIKDLGQTDWEFNYDDYFHTIKSYRREVGFGW